MRYIETKPLTMHIFTYQIEELINLQKRMMKAYNMKIPLSELVRQALNVGLPSICENEEVIINNIRNRRSKRDIT